LATRVGIELSPAACRIIEIEGGLPWVRRAPETRVLSFEILPPAGPETLAKLKALRKRSVAAVVWGVPTDHRQVIVSNRSYETMRREALAALAAAGIDTRGVLADIAPVSEGNDRSPRRPVTVALAASAPMMAALTSLTNLGIRVRSVLTPAAALTSLARTRRMFAVRGSIEAYVALEAAALVGITVAVGSLQGQVRLRLPELGALLFRIRCERGEKEMGRGKVRIGFGSLAIILHRLAHAMIFPLHDALLQRVASFRRSG